MAFHCCGLADKRKRGQADAADFRRIYAEAPFRANVWRRLLEMRRVYHHNMNHK